MHRIGLLVFFFIFSIQTIARPLAPPLPEVDFAADSNIGYTDEPVGTRSDLEAGPGSLLLASENTGKRKFQVLPGGGQGGETTKPDLKALPGGQPETDRNLIDPKTNVNNRGNRQSLQEKWNARKNRNSDPDDDPPDQSAFSNDAENLIKIAPAIVPAAVSGAALGLFGGLKALQMLPEIINGIVGDVSPAGGT